MNVIDGLENREGVSRTHAAYRAANRERIAKYFAAYRDAHREQLAKTGRAYRAANRDNVTTSGHTMQAAHAALGHGAGLVFADAATRKTQLQATLFAF